MEETQVQTVMPDDVVSAWFRPSKLVAKSRPEVFKMEGSLLPHQPGVMEHTAFYWEGERSHRVSVTAPMGSDWRGALAAALEADYVRRYGGAG